MVDLLLEEGHDVVAVDDFSTGRPGNLAHHRGSPQLKVVAADVCDGARMASEFAGAGWVFHFAALADIVPSIEHPERYLRANVMGTLGALEAARSPLWPSTRRDTHFPPPAPAPPAKMELSPARPDPPGEPP